MAGTKSHDRAQPKRTKLLDNDSSAEESGDEIETNGFGSAGFKINEEYAKRFEHNKKREERQRLEEKYGNSSSSKRKRLEDESDEDDSTDESEDDDADLVTADVDAEIFATLDAIKRKDPKVYDPNVKFYKDFDPDAAAPSGDKKSEKPMYLQDYHRQNLLAGQNGDEEMEDDSVPQTYQQEQDALKRQLVDSMHATNGEDEAEEDDFMVKKSKSRHEDMPAAKVKKITEADVQNADKDPETFLSNFMASRAWLPAEGSRFQALESDDSEDDARADEFEEAYNMRFENPETANEKLQSFARDVGKYSARREEKTGRKLAREREKEKKDAAKREREEEKARLRKLKIEEAEEKVKRIKEAAGMSGEELDLDQWRDVIEGDFDDDKWEQEMKRRFGEDYYAQDDQEFNADNDDEDEESGKASRKAKKPKWDDDIDINDLVPDFEGETKPNFTLSSDEDDDEEAQAPKAKAAKSSDAKRAARKERRKIEEIVDAALPVSHPDIATSAASSKVPVVGFRYRETSPTSFGLSARDILFAQDSQLNQYAGLKKMAAFRDEEKKRRDKKKFSKKARLKQWRKETFGDAEEPTGGFERILGGGNDDADKAGSSAKAGEGSKKKRKHKKKAKTAEA